MPNLYESIPPARREAYTTSAEQAFNETSKESIDRVVLDMGTAVVEDAVNITKIASGEALSDEDMRYLQAHDVASRRFRGDITGMSFGETMAAIDKAKSIPEDPSSISEDFAQRYLNEKTKQ